MAEMTPAPRTDDLDNRFGHHAPSSQYVVDCHESVRGQCRLVAQVFEHMLPASREKSLAITKLEEAMFWGNAAVARHMNS